jgi:hypothetical protein
MKFGFSRQIFIKVPKIKFHGNPSSENGADTCGRPTDGKGNRRFETFARARAKPLVGVRTIGDQANGFLFATRQVKFLDHINYSWLMRCATSRTVPVSIPAGVTGIFSDIFLPTVPWPWGRFSP